MKSNQSLEKHSAGGNISHHHHVIFVSPHLPNRIFAQTRRGEIVDVREGNPFR